MSSLPESDIFPDPPTVLETTATDTPTAEDIQVPIQEPENQPASDAQISPAVIEDPKPEEEEPVKLVVEKKETFVEELKDASEAIEKLLKAMAESKDDAEAEAETEKAVEEVLPEQSAASEAVVVPPATEKIVIEVIPDPITKRPTIIVTPTSIAEEIEPSGVITRKSSFPSPPLRKKTTFILPEEIAPSKEEANPTIDVADNQSSTAVAPTSKDVPRFVEKHPHLGKLLMKILKLLGLKKG